MNTRALEDIFARFHGELDGYLQAETKKLKKEEVSGSNAKELLQKSASRVSDFLRDNVPAVHAELGTESSHPDSLAERTLPQLLQVVDRDRQAIDEVAKLLTAFADRRFPKNTDIASAKGGRSPLPLLRELLLHMGGNALPKAASPRKKRERAATPPPPERDTSAPPKNETSPKAVPEGSDLIATLGAALAEDDRRRGSSQSGDESDSLSEL
eukprot:gnl/TRDRNA2_/TRDRNA2_170687_c2_seq2.p2 gnl/TRDRNA2_/TRDRNA2_170687_c2~~gnl/TRDRNA2_/TRDRNA2_170687_c2_seq2.p2  ORF type:complete len:212 (+),score=55.01 gnl/TRDRNA2_/TRDRNA2_170687_c2_seq2:316-951(+)